MVPRVKNEVQRGLGDIAVLVKAVRVAEQVLVAGPVRTDRNKAMPLDAKPLGASISANAAAFKWV